MCRIAASNWNGEGSFLFTSSTAVYDCSDNGFCGEVLVLWALYYTAYKCKLQSYSLCLLLNFVGTKSTPYFVGSICSITLYFLLILQTEAFRDSYRKKKLNFEQEKKLVFRLVTCCFVVVALFNVHLFAWTLQQFSRLPVLALSFLISFNLYLFFFCLCRILLVYRLVRALVLMCF